MKVTWKVYKAYLKSVLDHLSMPKNKNLPHYGSILNDNNIDYAMDDNMVDGNMYFRHSNILSQDSPFGMYLN